MEPIGVVCVALGLIGVLRGPRFAISVFVPSVLLGAAAALILGGAGNIQPAHMLLGFVALTVMLDRRLLSQAIHSLSYPEAGFWLLLTVSYGVVSAMFIPRILAGVTYVNAIGITEYGPALISVPLGPTSGNITQSIYLMGDLVCFMALSAFAKTPSGFRTLTYAVIAFCIGNLIFGFLDVVTFWTGTAFLLEPIRNSTYTLHIGTVVYGLKRIAGSFTEASVFAGISVACFAFTTSLAFAGFRSRLTGALAICSLLAILLSTATTGYAGLIVYAGALYVASMVRVLSGPVERAVLIFVLVAPLVAILLTILLGLNATAWSAWAEFLDTFLFGKATTESGVERAAWNQQAMTNFFDTYGLGAGVGSVRSSSFLIAVLSNIGIFGALTYGMFLFKVLKGQPSRTRSVGAVRNAARAGCIATLITQSLSGTLVDLGLFFFILASLANAGRVSPIRTSHPPMETSKAVAESRPIGRSLEPTNLYGTRA
jgi:hypothetical protein